MSDFILGELAKREQAWLATAVATSPATATKSANLRGQAEKLSAQAAELESEAVATADEIEILFQQRADLQRNAEFLGRLESDVARVETFASEALRELVLAGLVQEKFGLQRWEHAAASVSRLQVIAPVLPAYAKKNASELAAVESQIRSVAKARGVNLPGLIREIVAGGTQIVGWTE